MDIENNDVINNTNKNLDYENKIISKTIENKIFMYVNIVNILQNSCSKNYMYICMCILTHVLSVVYII